MRKFLNHSTVFGIIIGIVIGSVLTVVIAESINSSEVLYDNSNSSSKSDNVQGALDEVYNTLDKVGSGYSLIAHSPDGLSTELVAGLYRYQGIQDANNDVDNYICFGTTNKNDCLSNTDKYMYRIIGINTSGQMKLIKKEALSTTYQWNSSSDMDWAHSSLYNGLNDSYFLTNSTYIPDSTWSSRITTNNWFYGLVNYNSTPLNVYNSEISGLTVAAKIGLMYVSDYYYGLPGGNNCAPTAQQLTCKGSWLHISHNQKNVSTYEWTEMLCASNTACACSYAGNMDSSYPTNTRLVRPVFFLSAGETIASGSGTITDPYILS